MTLHIYGQSRQHDSVYIVGTACALILLRETLDKALRAGIADVDTMTNDGEGYTVTVLVEQDMDKLRLPYTVAQDWSPDGVAPWVHCAARRCEK